MLILWQLMARENLRHERIYGLKHQRTAPKLQGLLRRWTRGCKWLSTLSLQLIRNEHAQAGPGLRLNSVFFFLLSNLLSHVTHSRKLLLRLAEAFFFGFFYWYSRYQSPADAVSDRTCSRTESDRSHGQSMLLPR